MKLGRLPIFIIGIMFCIGGISYGYILCYGPNMKEVGMLNENKSLNDTEAHKMPQAQARVKLAKKMVDTKAAIWRAIVETRTPPMDLAHGGIDLSVNAWQLSVDTPKFRNSIQRAVNDQVKKGGVTVVSAPLVQVLDANMPVNAIQAAFYNYPALKFPVVIFDFGTITVQGTYKQILDNVRAYKNMPHYLAVTDGLRIDGTSPNLTGTYNLTIVGFIRSKSISGGVNEGAAAASTGGGPGGGPGGGRGGGPGGGGPGGGGKPSIGKTSGGG